MTMRAQHNCQLARIASRLQRQNVVLTIMCAALTINTVAIWSLPMLRAMERSQQHQRDQHSHHKSEVWHSVPQVQHEEHHSTYIVNPDSEQSIRIGVNQHCATAITTGRWS